MLLLVVLLSVMSVETGWMQSPLVQSGPQLFVNSTADPGDGSCTIAACTLREAIMLANTLPGENTIVFDLPGTDPHAIQPKGDLPTITDRLIIDGFTQPGATPNTKPMAEPINAALRVELVGIDAQNGLVIAGDAADGTVVRGLAINRFVDAGIVASSSVAIVGNYIGVDRTGTVALGNGVGVRIVGATDGLRIHPTVGGAAAAARNLIAANGDGIVVGRNSSAMVYGNFIGTDATGTKPMGNGRGILADGPAQGNDFAAIQLGGPLPGQHNLIAGNGTGIVYTYAHGQTWGNLIGTDRTGSIPLPNRGSGVVVLATAHTIINNRIAYNRGNGILAVEPINPSFAFSNRVQIRGNTIDHNAQDGIAIPGTRPGWQLVPIRQNVIYANGELGIDLGDDGVTVNDGVGTPQPDGDQGPNNLLNYPTLGRIGSDGTALVVSLASLFPNRTLTVDLFAGPTCDPAGHGEGQQFLSTVTLTKDAFGRLEQQIFPLAAVPPGYVVTATATDSVTVVPGEASGFTSEFSPCSPVAGIINQALQLTDVATTYSPLSVPGGPAGTFTIMATFQNTLDVPIRDLFFKVNTLTNQNQLVSADGGPADSLGVGAIQTSVQQVAPGATFTISFQIGLRSLEQFTFLVDSYGVHEGIEASATAIASGFAHAVTQADLQSTRQRANAIYLPLINR